MSFFLTKESSRLTSFSRLSRCSRASILSNFSGLLDYLEFLGLLASLYILSFLGSLDYLELLTYFRRYLVKCLDDGLLHLFVFWQCICDADKRYGEVVVLVGKSIPENILVGSV